MSDDPDAVRRGIASGAAWTISWKICDRLIAVISTAVLARLLEPEHFGVIALAMSLIALLDTIGDFSFELALIRDQQATEEHYHTGWTALLIKALLLFCLLQAIAGPAATAFGEPRLQDVIRFLSLTVLLGGVQSIRIVDMRKELEFDREFRFRIFTRLFGFILTLVLAVIRRDEWALVYGTLATEVVRLVLSYVMKPYRPRLTLSRFGEMFDFSKWLLIGNVCLAAMDRSPALVIGRLSNAQTVAFFTMSHDICNLASSELIAPIKRALFPGYSKLVSDYDMLRKVYLENFSVIVMLAMPIAAGIGVTAEFIVPLFLGPKWSEVIPLMQILAIHAALRTINVNSNPLYYATNRPKLAVASWAVEALALLPALWFAVSWAGSVGAALATVWASALTTVFDSWLVVRLLKVSWARFVGTIWRTAVATLVMGAAVTTGKALMAMASMSSILALLAVSCSLGVVSFAAAHLLLWRLSGRQDGAETILLDFFRRGLERFNIGRDVLSRAK
jgi:O-antigen/teichoic acid export membrane protein